MKISKMDELLQLIEQEIPEGRQQLQESYSNLEKVAQYCQTNYLQANDKRMALEETKSYTTHSLASVAYQINSLATNFLKLLDLQQNQLAEMGSGVNYLAQTVNIHKEKVARREIGVLTANRISNRPLGVKNGIIFPEQTEQPVKYRRKSIDYAQLDEIGHGVRMEEKPGIIKTPGSVSGQSQSQSQRTSRSSSMSSGSGHTQPTHSPTPLQGSRTIGHAQGISHYRTPAPPVAPPSVPGPYTHTNYAMSQTGMVQRTSGYSPSPVIGISRPISHNAGPPTSTIIMGTPPQIIHQGSVDSLPPPLLIPADEFVDDDFVAFEASLPLPTPPGTASYQHYDFHEMQPAPPPLEEFNDHLNDSTDEPIIPMDEDPYAATRPNLAEPRWIPKSYIEKVVAIYNYVADKSDELSFSENAVIYVVKKNDDDWWEGVLDGVTGLFPCNYVEPCI